MTEHVVRVAAGILIRGTEVLIAERHGTRHGSGLWEFPGGKPEDGEALGDALRRELREELAIDVESADPFHQVRHEYPERTVELHFFTVTDWRGEPRGAEGQRIAWVAHDRLDEHRFLAANEEVVLRVAATLSGRVSRC